MIQVSYRWNKNFDALKSLSPGVSQNTENSVIPYSIKHINHAADYDIQWVDVVCGGVTNAFWKMNYLLLIEFVRINTVLLNQEI